MAMSAFGPQIMQAATGLPAPPGGPLAQVVAYGVDVIKRGKPLTMATFTPVKHLIPDALVELADVIRQQQALEPIDASPPPREKPSSGRFRPHQ
jgi:hypothetical protein